MSETWKPVVGFERFYEVSDQGRVRSCARVVVRSDGRTHTVKPRIMKAPPTPSGHLHLNLIVSAKRTTVYVHTLVLEAFVGPAPAGMEACHDDDDPSNNALGNLRWGTRKANIEDRRRNGRLIVGEAATGAKLTRNGVVEIRRRLAAGERRGAIAREFNISESHLCNVVSGKAWAHV